MKIRVSAPSRLHLGDIDPFGLGRFGFAPMLALEKPRTLVEASTSSSLDVSGVDVEEAGLYSERVLKAFKLPGARVKVLSRAPRHSGFGSTTQLALSIGKAITLAYERDVNSVELVEALKRTSTGGVHTFQHGGFVVAGGLKVARGERILDRAEALIPPLIFQADVPETWHFVIVTPRKAAAGPFGDAEEDAFKRLHREQSPSHLIHEAYFNLMSKLVPSVLEKDAEAFEEALTRIQVLVGRMYQPVQGGVFNPASTWVIPILRRIGARGIGQSSWGPAVYAFAEDRRRAVLMEKELREEVEGRAEVFIAKADNSGVEASTLKTLNGVA
jgi:beta-ribofuranosylaminobenzene 5'-phosphate synthase